MNDRASESPVPALTDREFRQLRDLVLAHSGIRLSESKKALIYGRLARRVRELALGDFGAYYRRLLADPRELPELLDRVTTSETHFFREPHHFEYLATELVPRVVREAAENERPPVVRVWSAGCATGEEPYSIAMAILEALPRTGWKLDILATDLSKRALDVARSASWPEARAANLPRELLRRYMLRGAGSQQGTVRASSQLRAVVRTERLNLNDASYPQDGPFDVIFCRNVLIYFDDAKRQQVLSRLTARLAPGGLLFVGYAENARGVVGLRCVRPTVYARDDASTG